jgi:hypothetical protein
MDNPKKVRVLEPFIGMALFIVAVIYIVNAFNTGNWMWFRGNTVNVRPSRIIIIDHGNRTILNPGHSDFDRLVEATVQSLSELNNSGIVDVGLSEQTLSDYATDSLVLEMHFDSPVVFNTAARTGKPTQLLIPIEGRHADGGLVFRGDKGEWWYGAVRMANPQPLLFALEQMGFQVASAQPAG